MTPKQRVQGFARAMARWERQSQKKMDAVHGTPKYKAAKEAALEELREIYDEHLAPAARTPERWGAREHSLTAREPPQYEQKVEEAEDGPKAGVTYVFTRNMNDEDERWRYEVRTGPDGVPLIEEMKRQYADQPWKRGLY
jgi:hypothetical protein